MPLKAQMTIKKILLCFMLSTGISAHADVLPNTQIKLNEAISLHDKHQTQVAIHRLNTYVVERVQDRAEIYRLLGFLHWQQNDESAAIDALKQSLSLNKASPNQTSSRRMLADIYSRAGKHEQALKQYEYLVNAGEGINPEIWAMVANSAYQLGEWKKVIHAATRFTQRQSCSKNVSRQWQVVWLQKAVAQQSIHQWHQSLETLDVLITAFPDLKKGWQRKLYALQHLKQHRELLDTWRLALMQGIQFSSTEIKPLAHYFYVNGIPHNAAELIQAINEKEKHVELYQLEAMYWQAAKQWKKSNLAWDKLKTLNPVQSFSKVRNYYALGEWESALRIIKELKARYQLNERDMAFAKKWKTILMTYLNAEQNENG